MTLRKFDEIEIRGVHPRNPITDEPILSWLQRFVVVNDIDGPLIEPRDVYPQGALPEAVPMVRLHRVNGMVRE